MPERFRAALRRLRNQAAKVSRLGSTLRAKRATRLVALATPAALECGNESLRAVTGLRRAIALHASPPSGWRVRLTSALVASSADPGEIDAAYRAAILSRSEDVALVRVWIDELRSREVDAIGELIEFQLGTEQPLVGVLLAILGGPERDRAEQPLAGHVDSFLASPSAVLIAKVWGDFSRLRPLDPGDCQALGRLQRSCVRLALLLRRPRIVTPEEAVVEGFGVSDDAMRWYSEEFLREDTPPDWTERQAPSDWVRGRIGRDDSVLAYQTRLVRDRQLIMRDPHTGAEVAPFDSVMHTGRTTYSFGDRELTMFITAGAGSKAVLLLLPRLNLIIDLGAGLWGHLTPLRLASLQTELLRRVARCHAEYAAAIAQRPDPRTERSVVLMMTTIQNPAHHLWNCFPAIEKIIDLGLASRIDEIRTGGSEFYGPFIELFPEFDGVTVIDEERTSFRDPYPFSNEHLIVAPGGYFIRRSLVDRLVDKMADLSESGAATPPPPKDRPFPVVWIGLRVGSRSWVDQEHEVPRLIDALHEAYPDALVLLDGFSYPVGRDTVSDSWKQTLERVHELSDRIKSSVARPDQVVDMVGNTLREAVLWAAATDVYIAPNGSSQHKVGWLTDGPGISYAPTSLAKVIPEQRPGARESEGRPIPVSVFGSSESAGDRRSSLDRRGNLDNIRLDLDEVTRTLLGLIDERRASIRT